MSRTTIRILLGVSIFIAILVTAFAIKSAADGQASAWAVIAAALAVITAVVSAWNAQRVVELEEDRLLPYPYPTFDAKSRYGLILLRVTNHGNTAAHNIKLRWDEAIVDSKGNQVKFEGATESADITILMPKESLSVIVDGNVDFFKIQKRHQYKGEIEFTTPSGRKLKHNFLVDAEMYKGTPTYDDEELKTHYGLQKIPDALSDIRSQLSNIEKKLGSK